MIDFPQWSDLGRPADILLGSWEEMEARRELYRSYYDGTVLRERLGDGPEDERPLIYPAGMNVVKTIAVAQADALFGEWEDSIIQFGTEDEASLDNDSQEAIKLLSKIITISGLDTALWEVGLNRERFGGDVIGIRAGISQYPHTKWTHPPIDGFYPVWNPDDPDELLEAYFIVEMTNDQAKLRYKYDGEKQIVKRVEHWTTTKYENFLDGRKMSAYSGINPYGFVPFVYIPRMRTDNWWGDALTEDLIPVQNEMNSRLADIGDAINYNSHPIKWGVNLNTAFTSDNFEVGPDKLWNLGKQIGSMPKPEVGMLEAKNPIPSEVFSYLNFVYNWSMISSFTPPIVFGEDSGGGQRSGETLEIRMMPLVRATRRSRAYAKQGIQRLIWMTGEILRQKSYSDVRPRVIKKLSDNEVQPVFSTVLPRDHQKIVDEVVKLLSTEPKGISLETAQKALGRGAGEVQRILAMLKMKELFPMSETKEQNQVLNAERGKQQPQEGDNE